MTQVPQPTYSAADRIFIVPAAHVAIFRTRFQVEMYELFHRTLGGRLGHMIGTPTIVLGVLTVLHAATGLHWPGGLVIAGIVLVGLATDVLAASITGLLGLVLLGSAAALSAQVGGWALATGIGLIVLGCLVQTLSHAFEDVPPPHSGTSHFVPMGEWLRSITPREFLRSAVMTVGVFYWLELWATFRIWPLQVLHVLLALGYRPALRAELDARMEAIVEQPETDWRRPAPRHE